MKKKLGKLLTVTAVSASLAVVAPCIIMPSVVLADEINVGDTTEQVFKISTVTEFLIDSREDDSDSEPAEGDKYGYITSDRSEAKAGETVTIKAVSGTNATFAHKRYKITRVSDGADVTEQLLGEKRYHSEDGETFVMPSYDVTASGEMYNVYIGSPAIGAIVGTYDYFPVNVEQSSGGTVSVTDGVKQFGEIMGAQVAYDHTDEIKVKAVADPGYKFVKWYVYSYEWGVGVTDDLLLDAVPEKADENGERSAEATFKTRYGGIRISAVFEETGAHNISVTKNNEKVSVVLDKTTAKVGEKVHVKVDAADSDEPDLGVVSFKNSETGGDVCEPVRFIGHVDTWEGDLIMPDHDIDVDVWSYKWAPAVLEAASINVKQSKGGTVSASKDRVLKNETVDLSYKEDEGYVFKKWIITDSEGKDVTEEFDIQENGSFKVTKRGAFEVSAVFEKKEDKGENGNNENDTDGNKTGASAAGNTVSAIKNVSSPAASVASVAAPDTGDRDDIFTWGIAASASAIAAAGAVIMMRKRKDRG